jgi:hypothetical protein
LTSMAGAASLPPMGLSDRERAILDFERSWWVTSDVTGPAVEPDAVTSTTKEAAIRSQLDLSPTRYYELLRALSGSSEAAAYDPLVVHRLRRSQSQRRRARLEGWPASQPPAR